MNVQSYKGKLLQCENTSIKLHRNLDFDWPLQQPDSFFFSHFIVDLLFHDPVGIYVCKTSSNHRTHTTVVDIWHAMWFVILFLKPLIVPPEGAVCRDGTLLKGTSG